MALIACPECGKQVSTQASACPACGAPVSGSTAPHGGRREPVVNATLLGKIAAVVGAWLVVPWLVRLLAFLAGVAMLIVMFRSAR
ncbi:zinc ribbon domain-containing protein [Variovorax sp. DT-64]|uniref:zinc ribbon domain-containing protein n=1 Tax=Variovorax sp. DT-64 TaxID=3396160 RepID=UPI003F19FF2F